METVEFNDGLRPAGRRPRLILIKGAEVQKFHGEPIVGWCAIQANSYVPEGKWSRTYWTLVLAPGVRAVELLSPMHGVWGCEFEDWGSLAGSLQIPVEVAQDLIRREYPSTADRLDKLDAFAAEIESCGREPEVLIFSFSGKYGPAALVSKDGVEVSLSLVDGRWVPSSGRVVEEKHVRGWRGGSWTVQVML